MTTSEALRAAKARWGPNGAISGGTAPGHNCLVGAFTSGRFVILGIGETWDEAFARAGDPPSQSPPPRHAR